MSGPDDFGIWTPEGIIRSWAQAYRDTPECRFPSDPNAEFFPVDLEAAAVEIERLRAALAPFAADKLPSARKTEIAYNRWGLRCLMSPLEVARDAAYRALPALLVQS